MEITYTLVAENEADLSQKKISIKSPIAKGLLGKEKGEIADIQTPGGVMQFEIIDISTDDGDLEDVFLRLTKN